MPAVRRSRFRTAEQAFCYRPTRRERSSSAAISCGCSRWVSPCGAGGAPSSTRARRQSLHHACKGNPTDEEPASRTRCSGTLVRYRVRPFGKQEHQTSAVHPTLHGDPLVGNLGGSAPCAVVTEPRCCPRPQRVGERRQWIGEIV